MHIKDFAKYRKESLKKQRGKKHNQFLFTFYGAQSVQSIGSALTLPVNLLMLF